MLPEGFIQPFVFLCPGANSLVLLSFTTPVSQDLLHLINQESLRFLFSNSDNGFNWKGKKKVKKKIIESEKRKEVSSLDKNDSMGIIRMKDSGNKEFLSVIAILLKNWKRD